MNNDSKIIGAPSMKLPDKAPKESPTVTALRQRVEELKDETAQLRDENIQLRILVGGIYAGSALELEEGRAQDNRTEPAIDFLFDPPELIRSKMIVRACRKKAESSNTEEHY